MQISEYTKDQFEFICKFDANSELLRLHKMGNTYVYRRIFGYDYEFEQYYLICNFSLKNEQMQFEYYREQLRKEIEVAYVQGKLESIYVK